MIIDVFVVILEVEEIVHHIAVAGDIADDVLNHVADTLLLFRNCFILFLLADLLLGSLIHIADQFQSLCLNLGADDSIDLDALRKAVINIHARKSPFFKASDSFLVKDPVLLHQHFSGSVQHILTEDHSLFQFQQRPIFHESSVL